MSDTPSLSARKSNATVWWIAAVVAIVAVIGAFVLLSGARPSPAKLQATRDQGRAEAQIDDAAYSAHLAAAHAAKFAGAAAASHARAIEAGAQTGAASADATAQDASATEPAPR
jgi:hypothetical protein